MDRRDFLARSASSVGGILGMSLLGGCATTGGVRIRGDRRDAGHYLAALDGQIGQISRAAVAPELVREIECAGLPGTVIQDSLASLLVAGSFRDLPPDLQAEPAVQERVREELPAMGERVLRMGSFLDGLGDDRIGALEAFIHDEPDVVPLMREGMMGQAASCGLHDQRVAQFGQMLDGVGWRLCNQDPALLIGETTDRLDQSCVRCGVRRDEWRALAEAAAAARVDRPARDAARHPMEYAEECFDCDRKKGSPAAKLAAVGGIVMGIGALVLIPGVSTYYVGAGEYGVGIGAFPTTLGGIVTVVGLGMVIIASGMAYVEHREEECGRR